MIALGFKQLTALTLGAVCFLSSSFASAHAPPLATEVRWLDSPGGERVVVRTNRGFIVGDPATGSFRLVCNDAFGASLVEVPPVAEASGGALLVGTFAGGLLRSDQALCDFEPIGPAAVSPVDLLSEPAGTIRAVVFPLDGSDARLYESTNGGDAFEERAALSGAPSALLQAPSRPNRLYISTTTADGNLVVGHVLVSDDGGREFTDHELELDGSELRVFVSAVDPADPDLVFVRTQSRDRVTLERILRSDDAGLTFETVLQTEGPIKIVVDRGGDVWAGGLGGLFRSRDAGVSFEVVEGIDLTRIDCLAVHADALYVCGFSEGEFGVLVSNDQGTTFDWFLRFPEVTARLDCPSSSDEAAACEAAFADWAREQSGTVPEGGSAGGGSTNGNVGGAGAMGGGSGVSAGNNPAASAGAFAGSRTQPATGCQIKGSRAGVGDAGFVALLGLAALRWRRRARRA